MGAAFRGIAGIVCAAAAACVARAQTFPADVQYRNWAYLASTKETAALTRPAHPGPSGNPRLWVRFENATGEIIGVFAASGAPIFVKAQVVLNEFDCVERRVKTLQASYYSERNMGGESTTASGSASAWSYAQPDTFADAELSRACPQRPTRQARP